MRSLSPEQREALSSPATMLATCWRITRTDGEVLRMADADVEIVVDAQTYAPNGSTERTAVTLSDGLSPDNLDIRGVLNSALITDDDLELGRYDYAQVDVFLAFANLDLPPISLAQGKFGEIEMDNGAYTAEINGLTHALQTTIGEVTTPTCRATFGDGRCLASLSTWRHTYTLAGVSDARTLTLTGPSLLPAGTYKNGLIEMMDGPAEGLSMEIRAHSGLGLTLYLPLAVLPEAGDTLRVTAGCDKTRSTCRDVFENVINFQGEPDVPGVDALFAPGIG
jgi:uncharacterized phage protein (TIGR02218 family)